MLHPDSISRYLVKLPCLDSNATPFVILMFRPKAETGECFDRFFNRQRIYDLNELGLYLRESDDTIRILAQPEERYRYRMKLPDEKMTGSSAEFYNDSLWLAMTKTLSQIVKKRLATHGVMPHIVPIEATEEEPHTCVYHSEGHRDCKELIVVLPGGMYARTTIYMKGADHQVVRLECGPVGSSHRNLLS